MLKDHALQEAVLEAAHKKRLGAYRKREKGGKLTERDLQQGPPTLNIGVEIDVSPTYY